MLQGWKLTGVESNSGRRIPLMEISAGEVKNSKYQNGSVIQKEGWLSSSVNSIQALTHKGWAFDTGLKRWRSFSIAVQSMQDTGLGTGITLDRFVIEAASHQDPGTPKYSIVLRNCQVLKSVPYDLRSAGGGSYREVYFSVNEVEFITH